MDEFKFKIYWGQRVEKIDEVSDGLYAFFQDLVKKFNKITWYNLANSKKSALENKFIVSRDNIKKQLLHDTDKKDIYDKFYSKIGFSFYLFGEDENKDSYNINACIGASSKYYFNNLILKIPKIESIDKENLVAIFISLIEIFNPDYGVLDSSILQDELHIYNNKLGWLTYVKGLKEIEPINRFTQKYIDNRGLLIQLSTNTELVYDYHQITSMKKLQEKLLI